MKRTKFSGRSGFTLIELLVVIGIIVVLAAMIVPKISGAKGKALQVSCSTNMKNIVKAMQLYVQDFPAANCPGVTTATVGSATMTDVAGSLYYRSSDKSGGLTTMNIWVCPALKSDTHQGPTKNAAGYYNEVSVGANNFIDYAIIKNGTAFPDFQNDPDDNAVLTEDGKLHGGVGRNIAFIGGNVEFMADADINTYNNIDANDGSEFGTTVTNGNAFVTAASNGVAWATIDGTT